MLLILGIDLLILGVIWFAFDQALRRKGAGSVGRQDAEAVLLRHAHLVFLPAGPIIVLVATLL